MAGTVNGLSSSTRVTEPSDGLHSHAHVFDGWRHVTTPSERDLLTSICSSLPSFVT